MFKRILCGLLLVMLVACDGQQKTVVVVPQAVAEGEIALSVIPAEARIYMPGLQRELSSVASMSPGRYLVEISAPLYQTERIWVEVSSAQRTELSVRLQKLEGSVQFDIWPPGTDLLWQNTAGLSGRMATPQRIDIAIGEYQLRFEKPGYRPEEIPLSVTGKGIFRVELRLDPEPRHAGVVFADRLLDGSQGPQMVVLPLGEYVQGDIVGDGDWQELPLRKVSLTKMIAIGQTEVTRADYRRFVVANRLLMPAAEADGDIDTDALPIAHVSWQDAHNYALWLSEQTGEIYRLPSESEWEYAARGGSQANYSFGSTIECDDARFDGMIRCGKPYASPVQQYAANAFGLYDMHGNLWEWTLDCAVEDYTGAPVDGSAFSKESCQRSMLRGGSYMLNAHKLRVSYRSWRYRDYRHADTGFRLVRELAQ